MSKHKFKVGQNIRHYFSIGEIGHVVTIRNDPKGYDYYVVWASGREDWYKEPALVALP